MKQETGLTISPPPPEPSAMSSSSSSIDPSHITQIGLIGFGISSNVYLYSHNLTKQSYAVKIIRNSHDENICRGVFREIDVLRATNNPFIIHYHGHYEYEGSMHIILEYMDHTDISSFIWTDEETLADMAYQILQGLAYLHSKKIVHRDLKPRNILINSQGEFKIADFGFSWVMAEEMRICTRPLGVIHYCSPELMNLQPYDGYANDIWSFGITILECSLGRVPLVQVDTNVLWEGPTEASDDFRSFINCCLQNKASDRWTAEQLLGHPFITNRDDGNAQALIGQNPTGASSSSSSSSNAEHL